MAWGKSSTRGVDDLVAQLSRNCTADTMCVMRSRKLGPNEVNKLADALATNTSLKEFLIAGHRLDPDQARRLGAAVRANSGTLEQITLGDSTFGDSGLGAFLDGIMEGQTSGKLVGLRALDFEYRGLGPMSATRLGAVLAASAQTEGPDATTNAFPRLRNLVLGRNGLATESLAFGKLLKGIRAHNGLHFLDLSGTWLSRPAECDDA